MLLNQNNITHQQINMNDGLKNKINGQAYQSFQIGSIKHSLAVKYIKSREWCKYTILLSDYANLLLRKCFPLVPSKTWTPLEPQGKLPQPRFPLSVRK